LLPNAATRPLFERAAGYQMAMSFRYFELTPDGHHFNTCILTDKSARIVGTYRKNHLSGHSEFDTKRAFQHLEKRYFEPGDEPGVVGSFRQRGSADWPAVRFVYFLLLI